LVRLDVDGRHEALTLPGDSCGIVDDPLVVVCDGTFHARDGAGWRELASGFLGEVRYVAIGPGDIVWVLDDVGALWRGAAGGWVSQALPGPALEPFAIAATPDGSVWVGGASGLDRLIDGAWRRYAAPEVGDADLSSLDVAPDGTLWGIGIAWGATFPPGDRIIAVQLVGDRFTAFEVPIDPASAFGMSPVITASATGVYASVWGALYRFTGSGFEPVDPGPAKRLESVSSIAVDGAGVALVVAGDVGAVDHEPVVYRVADGYEIVGDLGPTYLRTGPDGTVWAIAPSGPQRWTGTRFEPLGPPIGLAAAALGRLPAFAVGPDGMPYLAVGRTCVEDVEGTPVCDTTGERVAHLEGGAWVELPPHPGQASGIEWIAVAPDGAVWVSTGSDADTVDLARFAAGAWQAVTLPERAAGAAPVAAVHGLAFGQGGAVWAVFELEELPDFEWAKVVGRLDGEAWTVYESVDGQGLTAGRGTAYRDVIVGRDGTVWTNSREGIARFDGERWEWAIEGLSGLANLTLGADGSIWAGGRGVYRLTVAEDR
jgi:hypothetical protein